MSYHLSIHYIQLYLMLQFNLMRNIQLIHFQILYIILYILLLDYILFNLYIQILNIIIQFIHFLSIITFIHFHMLNSNNNHHLQLY